MSPQQRLSLRIGLLMFALMLAALAATAVLALKAFERELVPEIENKALTLSRSVSGLLGRAASYDIPLAELVGVDNLFRDVMQDNPEIGLLAIANPDGKLVHRSRAVSAELEKALATRATRHHNIEGLHIVSLPIESNGTQHGTLHVGARANFVQSVLQENLLDVLVVMVVAFFVAFEIAYFFAGQAHAGAGNDIAARLGVVRAPLFLFLVAEDLSRAFMPLYAAELFTPVAGLGVKFVQGLPIMVFMLIVGLSQPLMGSYSERIGRRKLLLGGAIAGAISHLGAAFAFSLYDLLAWRALAGLAWGVLFVAGQGYVLDHTNAATRTRGLAFFVGVIMVASACGPSMGGILAEGIGLRGTLIVAAVLALGAAALVWARLPSDPVREHSRALKLSNFIALARNRRFLTLLLTAAMPAKIILIGFCFFLVPLYIPAQGASTAMAGRLIMLYAIVMVVAVPFFARWSGDASRRWRFVAVGIAVSGLAGLMPMVLPGVPAIAAMVMLLGVGQALSIAPQTAMVTGICTQEVSRLGEGAVLGIYRFIERLGNVLGPLIAAALLQGLSYSQTFAAIGALMLVAATIFALTFRHGEARA